MHKILARAIIPCSNRFKVQANMDKYSNAGMIPGNLVIQKHATIYYLLCTIMPRT